MFYYNNMYYVQCNMECIEELAPSRFHCTNLNSVTVSYWWFSLTSYQNSEAVNNRFRFQNVRGIVKGLKLHFWAKFWSPKAFCSRVIGKWVLDIFSKKCMERPSWCPFEGHKYGRRKPTKTSVFEFSYKSVNSSLKELTNIKVVFILRKGMFR